jgi:hypothetical protein
MTNEKLEDKIEGASREPLAYEYESDYWRNHSRDFGQTWSRIRWRIAELIWYDAYVFGRQPFPNFVGYLKRKLKH